MCSLLFAPYEVRPFAPSKRVEGRLLFPFSFFFCVVHVDVDRSIDGSKETRESGGVGELDISQRMICSLAMCALRTIVYCGVQMRCVYLYL